MHRNIGLEEASCIIRSSLLPLHLSSNLLHKQNKDQLKSSLSLLLVRKKNLLQECEISLTSTFEVYKGSILEAPMQCKNLYLQAISLTNVTLCKERRLAGGRKRFFNHKEQSVLTYPNSKEPSKYYLLFSHLSAAWSKHKDHHPQYKHWCNQMSCLPLPQSDVKKIERIKNVNRTTGCSNTRWTNASCSNCSF